MINEPPPPYPQPYPPPTTQPIGFEQPLHTPLNAVPQHVPITNLHPSGGMYGGTPLLQDQARIHALNATPRTYNSGWRRYSSGDRKVATIVIAVVGLLFIIIFLVIFFTVFKKANDSFDEATKKHDEFRKKHFPDW